MTAPHQTLASRRILVYGVTGSGKSTLARRIAEATGVPLYLVDEHTWRPGWAPVPEDEQRARFEEICARDEWVLDTAYKTWLDVPLARTQLLVALDYPRLVSLGRLLRRTAMRIVDRRPICNGNYETLRQALSSDSIVAWHFRSFSRKRRQMRAWAVHPPGPVVLLFRHPRDADRWLSTLSPRPGADGPEHAAGRGTLAVDEVEC
jgi:adenylate kinase family enzyme